MWLRCALLFPLINFIATSNLTLFPDEIYAVKDNTLDVLCSLSPQYAIDHGFNSTRLSFVIQSPHNGELTPYGNVVEIVNWSTKKLKFKIVREYHNCHLICFVLVGNRRIEKIQRLIHVEDVLPCPQIVEYHVLNWEHLYFTWNVNVSDRAYKPLQYSAWFKNSNEHSNYTRCRLYSPYFNECIVENVLSLVAMDSVMLVRVDVSNEIGNSASTEIVLQLLDIVKPSKVMQLQCDTTLSDNTLVCDVEFYSPKPDKLLSYSVVLSCNGGSFTSTLTINATRQQRITGKLDYIPAYSNCSVIVTAKPSGFGFVGLEEKLDFKTKELVPLASPEVCKSCFEVRPHNHSNLIDVVLYFKPLPHELARGLISEYRLVCINQIHGIKRVFPGKNSYSWLIISGLLSNVEYDFTLRAGNGAGFNDSLTVVPICISKNDTDRLISRPVVTLMSETEVKFQWEPVLDAQTYTFFWCRADSTVEKKCLDVIQWKQMSVNASSAIISLPLYSSASAYKYGMSVETISRWNSGIIWSSCLYDVTSVHFEPPTLMLSNVDNNQISVTLVQPMCSDVIRGIAKAFNVYYCHYNGDHYCSGATKQLKVDAAGFNMLSLTSVTVNGLSPGQKYLVVVETLTGAGIKGSRNATIVVTTKNNGNDRSIVIVLVVIISILLAIIFVGVVHRAIRCVHWHNNRQSALSHGLSMQQQLDSGGYETNVGNSGSTTTTSLSAPLMRDSERQPPKTVHLTRDGVKAMVTGSDLSPNTDLIPGERHAGHQLKPHSDLEPRILPWISDSDEQRLSMPSVETSRSVINPLASGGPPDCSRHSAHTIIPGVHAAASYPVALNGVAERLLDVEHSSLLANHRPADFRHTVRNNEDMSYSHCSRQSL